MLKVRVEKPAKEQLEKQGVFNWPIWEKEISCFDWYYDEKETCYFLAGKVVLETSDGSKIQFGKGDLVIFPKGLKCVWDIKEPVKKHYLFE